MVVVLKNYLSIFCKLFRLIAEKINKDERKNEAEIVIQDQGYEDYEFWNLFGGYPDEIEAEELSVYRHKHPRLYKVCDI